MPTALSSGRLAGLPLALSLALGMLTPAHAAVNSVFKPVLSELKKTHVPVLLPTVLPKNISPPRLYTAIVTVSAGAYEIDIAYAPNCHEATACHAGYARGERPGRGTTKLAGQKVRLARNVTGYYLKFDCGASCGDSTLAWNEHGYRYTFGLHAGAFKPLLTMVNSAIESGPVAP